MSIFWELLVVLGLLLTNGFFAMAEMALVSSRRSRLQELATSDPRGVKAALALIAEPSRLLSTVQIGITSIGILAGAYSGAAFAGQLGAWLDGFAIFRPYGTPIAIATVVAAITYLSLIIGELVPKQIAIAHPERVAVRVAPLMLVLSRIAHPFVTLLQSSTHAMLLALRISVRKREMVSESEVRALVREGTESGVFAAKEHEMVSEVMRLDDRPVRTIMTPRRDVLWLDVNASKADVASLLATTNHSRFPVGDGSLEKFVGIVSAKRLLEQAFAGGSFDIRAVMRAPIVVPETQRVLDVLDVFKKTRPHMAIVVDEYAAVQGIVTPSDILETITGDFSDGGATPSIAGRHDGSWLIDGEIELVEIDERIGTQFAGADPYRSLAAFLLHEMQRLPKEGDVLAVDAWRFEIADMDGRRIDKVILRRVTEVAAGELTP
jgi:putative hemolysin